MTAQELETKMLVLLGGRAAEWIVFRHLSTGAADDLQRVTDIARAMVTRYGMSETLGHVAYEREASPLLAYPGATGAERPIGDDTATAIDKEVRSIVERAFERAVQLLERERDALVRGAHLLLGKETLAEAEISALISAPPPAPHRGDLPLEAVE